MTPIQLTVLRFVAERRIDRATGRTRSVDLREISEAMRQRIIDLGMMAPPLVDVDGPRVFLTLRGEEMLRDIVDEQLTDGGGDRADR